MASEGINTLDVGYVASASITQYSVVKLGTNNGTVTPATHGSDAIIGIAQATVASGETVNVRLLGRSKCLASTTITKGTVIGGSTTSGKAATISTTAYRIIGFAEEAATSSSDIIWVMLTGVSVY